VPAIRPERLKNLSVALAEHFANPPVYLREMHNLMDYYADRARRPGQAGRPGPLISAYNVRPPVLRALLQQLLPRAEQDRETALKLCDALWEEPYLEFRQLAAMLLGRLDPDPPEPILARLQAWITTRLELHLIETLLSVGVDRLHREQPQALLNLIANWLDNIQPFYQQLGLRALLPLINDPNFENIPIFYPMIQPLCQAAPGALRPDLLEVVSALARRSPPETAFFLRQTLGFPDAPLTPWLLRQSLNQFPLELQAGLRSAVRDADQRMASTRGRAR
jgi:hypothetical protein